MQEGMLLHIITGEFGEDDEQNLVTIEDIQEEVDDNAVECTDGEAFTGLSVPTMAPIRAMAGTPPMLKMGLTMKSTMGTKCKRSARCHALHRT